MSIGNQHRGTPIASKSNISGLMGKSKFPRDHGIAVQWYLSCVASCNCKLSSFCCTKSYTRPACFPEVADTWYSVTKISSWLPATYWCLSFLRDVSWHNWDPSYPEGDWQRIWEPFTSTSRDWCQSLSKRPIAAIPKESTPPIKTPSAWTNIMSSW